MGSDSSLDRIPVAKQVAATKAWKEFVEVYQTLTDVLCVAAKDGCTEKLEREYMVLRRWFLARYCGVSDALRPYLSSRQVQHSRIVRRTPRKVIARARQLDLVEAIFHQQTVRAILDEDSGDLISRISKLSDAVYRCDTEFRLSRNRQEPQSPEI
jgi:hypothetical protein